MLQRLFLTIMLSVFSLAAVGQSLDMNLSNDTAEIRLNIFPAGSTRFGETQVNLGLLYTTDEDYVGTAGLMVVGDAAHQVNAIHGGGVFEASFAGQLAGRVAAEAIERGDVSEAMLMKYDREWRAARGEILHRIYKLRRAIEQLSDQDLNYLAEQLTGEDVVAFANGERLGKLAKILMKRPHLIKAAKELM